MKGTHNEINYRLAVADYLRGAEIFRSSIESIRQVLGISRTTASKIIANMHAAGEIEIIQSGPSKYCRLKIKQN